MNLPQAHSCAKSSRKIYREVFSQSLARPIRIGLREVLIKDGSEAILFYDTSGPEKISPARSSWIAARKNFGAANVTQLHYAKRGIITPEMEYVAARENLLSSETRISAEFVR